MKNKLFYLQSLVTVALCVIFSLSFVSCSDDDDDSGNNAIVGTWRLTTEYGDDWFWYSQYHFKSNGTFEYKDWSSNEKEPPYHDDKGTYTLSESFITIVFDEVESETYRYVIDGKKLTIFDYEDEGPNYFYKL